MRGAVQTPPPAPPPAPASGVTAPAPASGVTAPAPFSDSAAPAASGPNDQSHCISPGWVDRPLKLTSFKSTESRDDGAIQQLALLHSRACSMSIFAPLGTSNNPAWSTKLLLTDAVPAAPCRWVKPNIEFGGPAVARIAFDNANWTLNWSAVGSGLGHSAASFTHCELAHLNLNDPPDLHHVGSLGLTLMQVGLSRRPTWHAMVIGWKQAPKWLPSSVWASLA